MTAWLKNPILRTYHRVQSGLWAFNSQVSGRQRRHKRQQLPAPQDDGLCVPTRIGRPCTCNAAAGSQAPRKKSYSQPAFSLLRCPIFCLCRRGLLFLCARPLKESAALCKLAPSMYAGGIAGPARAPACLTCRGGCEDRSSSGPSSHKPDTGLSGSCLVQLSPLGTI